MKNANNIAQKSEMLHYNTARQTNNKLFVTTADSAE